MKQAHVDPRITRTHKALHDALAQLLVVTSFEDVSMNALAASAGINRATVYKHYADKFALLDAWISDAFQQRLLEAHAGPRLTGDEKLGATIRAACLCMAWLRALGRPDDRLLKPIADARMRSVLLRTVEFGLTHKLVVAVGPRALASAMAAAAIHAAAEEWARSAKDKGLAQHTAKTIEALAGLIKGNPRPPAVSAPLTF